MDLEYSFTYIFFDLLEELNPLELELYFELYYVEEQLENEARWHLEPIGVSGINKEDYQKKLREICETIFEKIKHDRNVLSSLIPFFIPKIEEMVSEYKTLIKSKEKFEENVRRNRIKLIYEFPSFDMQEYKVRSLHLSKKQVVRSLQEAETYDHLIEELNDVFNWIISHLKLIIIFLRHQLNVIENQKEKLKHSGNIDKYIDWIRSGRISELLGELAKDEKYKFNSEILQISALYHNLEIDKSKNVLKREDYDLQLAKLIDSIIQILTRDK